MKKKLSIRTILIIAVLIVIAEMTVSLFVGKYPISYEQLIAGDVQTWRVLRVLRIPRIHMSIIGGFAFGVSGMVYQTVFRNPLASPDIIGVTSGASAGAAFAILFLPASAFYVTTSAFVGSLIAVLLSLALATLAPAKNKTAVVLAGIAVHSLAQTALMVLKLTADPEKELASIEYWMMGSLNAITMREIPSVAVVFLISTVSLFLLYRQVLLLSVDEEEASLLGVPVRTMRVLVLIMATLLVASVVSVTGLISFVGLLAPHTARMLTKDNRVSTLWLSGLCGAGLMCLADILARSVSVNELPISIFTSLLGAPFLVSLLMRKGGE